MTQYGVLLPSSNSTSRAKYDSQSGRILLGATVILMVVDLLGHFCIDISGICNPQSSLLLGNYVDIVVEKHCRFHSSLRTLRGGR